ncbi:CYTH-like domain-containing protein [Lipomyces japonicus]|uniref:CYTH-like domain-containing protein n=1 Tax=Lipomyces japonicus TaxID=56871 RepID=UPI0034CE52AD
MDLRSIINTDGSNNIQQSLPSSFQPPPPPPPPPPQRPQPRRTSSIADIVDAPGTPPLIPSPISHHSTPATLPGSTPNHQQMMRAAAASSPTLLARPALSSPTVTSSGGQLSRSRSMSITSITTNEEPEQSRSGSISSTIGAKPESPIHNSAVASNNNNNNNSTKTTESIEKEVKETEKKTSKQRSDESSKKDLEIKLKSRKPKKYNTPPIFARKWTPNWREQYGLSNGKPHQASPGHSSFSNAEFDDHAHKREELSHDGSSARAANDSKLKYTTFTDVVPYEDLSRRVASWVFANIADLSPELQSQVEIEAKVGVIMMNQSRKRLVIPADSEVLLNMDMLAGTVTFESEVGELQHRAFQKFLESSVESSKKWSTPIKFIKEKTRDVYYKLPPAPGKFVGPQGNRFDRLRVSIDTDTNKVTAKIVKTRIKDLMIHCPGSKFDYRISLNIEKPDSFEPTPSTKPIYERVKDRVSYLHGNSRVDLTQVGGTDMKSHELEIELDIQDTLQNIAKIRRNERGNDFEDGIRSFLDNVRILVRRGGIELSS